MKKLLIIVGAGGSIQFGMPSVADVDTLFEGWAKEYFPLTAEPNKTLYTWTKEQLKAYCSQNPRTSEASYLNFENVLYTMQLLSELERDKEIRIYKNRLNAFCTLHDLPTVTRFKREVAKAQGNDFSSMQQLLLDHLLNEMRTRCQTIAVSKKDELAQLQDFLHTLQEDFQLGFINLNYDNVILSSLPNLKTGFDHTTGEFQRSQLYDPSWNFCYHLHGSVHFDMRGGDQVDMHGIRWNPDLHSRFRQNSHGRSGNLTGEGIMHPNSNIIAGLDKANQVLKEPFAQYFAQVDRLIYEADAILFMGYGFADFHLNKLFPFIRLDHQKTRKVVILDYANDGEDGLVHRQDDWTIRLFATIPSNAREMGHSLSTAKEYKDSLEFERSNNPAYPLSVWYNGLLEGCKHPDKFLKELQ